MKMTVQEMFVKAYTEATGQPKQEVAKAINQVRKFIPNGSWDDEITGRELEESLEGLTAEAISTIKEMREGR